VPHSRPYWKAASLVALSCQTVGFSIHDHIRRDRFIRLRRIGGDRCILCQCGNLPFLLPGKVVKVDAALVRRAGSTAARVAGQWAVARRIQRCKGIHIRIAIGRSTCRRSQQYVVPLADHLRGVQVHAIIPIIDPQRGIAIVVGHFTKISDGVIKSLGKGRPVGAVIESMV